MRFHFYNKKLYVHTYTWEKDFPYIRMPTNKRRKHLKITFQ